MLIERGRVRNNLLRLYRQSKSDELSRGCYWYQDANTIMSRWAGQYHLPLETVACVTAAISPQCDWERNLMIAEEVLRGKRRVSGGALPVNVGKARQVKRDRATSLDSYFIEGLKVKSFAANLWSDYSKVTIDTHMAQAALDNPIFQSKLRPKVYSLLAECVRETAMCVGLSPASFQATLWLTWKRIYSSSDKRKMKRKQHGT